ncbi:MAG: hypothetical protein COB61_009190 [Thiotrichales bacterium]|nr:hypothetical protein [Thiotrichales bacterium]
MFGYFLKNNSPPEFMLVLAFFSFALSLLIAHQDFCIAIAANFCSNKLKPNLGKGYLWNNCASSSRVGWVKRLLRFFSQITIIGFPPVAAYFYVAPIQMNKGVVISETEYGIWAVILIVASLLVLFFSMFIRWLCYGQNGE